MTRLFERPDPNPKKVLEVMIAGAIMDTPQDDLEWDRSTDLCKIQMAALAGSQISLALLQEVGASDDAVSQTVRKYAEDYLLKLCFSKNGFSFSALYLADELVHSSSPYIDTYSSVRRGRSWYVVCNCVTTMHLRARTIEEDQYLLWFDRKFSETYQEIKNQIESECVQTPDDKATRLVQLQDEICDSFRAWFDQS